MTHPGSTGILIRAASLCATLAVGMALAGGVLAIVIPFCC